MMKNKVPSDEVFRLVDDAVKGEGKSKLNE